MAAKPLRLAVTRSTSMPVRLRSRISRRFDTRESAKLTAMNIAPTTMKTWSRGASTPVPVKGLPLVLVTIRALRSTSWIAMMLTSVVSLLRVMSCETVAGTIRLRPCGRMTNRIDFQ